jgi:amidase
MTIPEIDQDALLPAELNEATIADLQRAMSAGELSAVSLAQYYLRRIDRLDQYGPRVNSIIECNPDALELAERMDAERRMQGPRGPLHGIPVVLKDNIETADRMQTTAGSLALAGVPAAADATVVGKLRAAGAVILAKGNMCEWAESRSPHRFPGWSARGGQTKNPYALDRNPSGSSGGPAAAVAANFSVAALGTETDGSILTPASVNGVVGIKPTFGLTSCAGVIHVSRNMDVVGTFGRTVADAATVLSAIASTTADLNGAATATGRDQVRGNYESAVCPDGLKEARVGIVREKFTGLNDKSDAAFDRAVLAMANAGSLVVDPVNIPTLSEIYARISENIVLCYDLKHDLDHYLSTRADTDVKSLADLIAFNGAHAEQELEFFGQELFEKADTDPYDRAKYQQALARMRKIGGVAGIDAVLQRYHLDAIVVPSAPPALIIDHVNGEPFIFGSSMPAAIAGYPAISVPMGNSFGLPLGITFIGTAFQEEKLIRLASGFEHVMQARIIPRFLRTVSLQHSEPSPGPSGAPEQTMEERRRAVQTSDPLSQAPL